MDTTAPTTEITNVASVQVTTAKTAEEEATMAETSSASSHNEDSSISPKSARVVKFHNIHIQEYHRMLGDHPSVLSGPAITLEWQPVRSHLLTVDDYESAFEERNESEGNKDIEQGEVNDNSQDKAIKSSTATNRRRRGQELRMPHGVRADLLKTQNYTAAELQAARADGRRIRAQRNMTRALEELDGLTALWESAGRKYKRWMQRRKNKNTDAPLDPAEAWLQQYKLQLQQKEFGKEHYSWHGEAIPDVPKDEALVTQKSRSLRHAASTLR